MKHVQTHLNMQNHKWKWCMRKHFLGKRETKVVLFNVASEGVRWYVMRDFRVALNTKWQEQRNRKESKLVLDVEDKEIVLARGE